MHAACKTFKQSRLGTSKILIVLKNPIGEYIMKKPNFRGKMFEKQSRRAENVKREHFFNIQFVAKYQ